MRASTDGAHFYLHLADHEVQWARKLAAVPAAKVDKTGKIFKFPCTRHTRVGVRRALGNYIELALMEPERSILKIDPPAELARPFNMLKESWPDQIVGTTRIIQDEAVMASMGMGSGKTKTLIEAVKYVGCRMVLVACPKSKVQDWVDEFWKWARIEAIPLTGAVAGRTYLADQQLKAGRNPLVLVTNIDSVWREPLGGWLLSHRWDLVAVDESQAISSPSAQTTEFMCKLTLLSAKRVCLTGTPMRHRPVDVFGQYKFLDPGVFGTNHSAFLSRYVVMSNENGTGKILGYRNEEELSEKFHALAFEADRPRGLPPTRDIDLEVALDEAEQVAYDQMNNDLVAELDSGAISAANGGVKMGKLTQLTSGFLIDTPTGEIKVIGRSKLDRLSGWLQELGGEPAVIFTRFTEEIRQITALCEELGIHCLEMSGRTNQQSQWQNGVGQVLLAQHKSGSVGVDMTRACYCAYYNKEFSLNVYEQSRMRLDRPGQTRPVAYYHFVVPNSIDYDLRVGLQEKRDVINYILAIARKRAMGVHSGQLGRVG